VQTAGGTVELRVAEGEDAPVGGDQPVAGAVRVMPTMGLLSAMPPVEPQNCALPNENTPPSEATSQYPPFGSATPSTIGLASGTSSVSPS
jgi:hypothetical protein